MMQDLTLADQTMTNLTLKDLTMPEQTALLHCWTCYYQNNRYMLYVSTLQVLKRYVISKFTLLFSFNYVEARGTWREQVSSHSLNTCKIGHMPSHPIAYI